jgi:hypothetical protein
LSVLTTDQKGVLAEQAIVFEALKFGAGVFQPLGDERYDLILDLRPALMRIQCKWAVRREGVVAIPTRRCRRGPAGFIHRGYAPLRVDPTKNNQASRINWARDFELGATLARLQGPIAQLGERLRGTQKVAGSSPAGSTLGAA